MSKRPPDAAKQKRIKEHLTQQRDYHESIGDDVASESSLRMHRVRAHTNPFADRPIDHPVRPSSVDWNSIYNVSDPPTVADIGCAWGGLELELGQRFPGVRVVGFELRQAVAEKASSRIRDAGFPGVAVVLCHCEKHLACWLEREQLDRIIVAFPDPHWKPGDQTRRIHRGLLSEAMLAQYAFFLRDGGMLYMATDVCEFADIMFKIADEFPLFQRVPESEVDDDLYLQAILTSTEQARLIDRHKGKKYWAVYRRISRRSSS